MFYYSTNHTAARASLREAVVRGLAEDRGLYMPEVIKQLPQSFWDDIANLSFQEVAYRVADAFFGEDVKADALRRIVNDTLSFDVPVLKVEENIYSLELFHGPTLAFKDVGARFMARLLRYFAPADGGSKVIVLVATSGDTGSAVGSAFHNVPGLDVTILYPEGKISPLQEKQLSTFDGNVRALKVKGTFDDCQKLVKTAFTDNELRAKLRLSSANSINISRLLPQSFYYMYSSLAVRARSWGDNKIENPAIICVVPSGNFGNLTSGLIAREMGAPITGFVAATNSNRTIPDWIATGDYKARPSVETYANAMDVGAPSNYERIQAMYSLEQVRSMFASYWLDNDGIIDSIKNCYEKTGYTIDPHGAVGWKAWSDIRGGAMEALKNGTKNDFSKPGLTPNLPSWADKVIGKEAVGIILETAHPAKFGATVQKATGQSPSIPDRLEKVMKLEDKAIPMENSYEQFKDWLLANL